MPLPMRGNVESPRQPASYRSWLRGDLELVGLLALATALLAVIDRLGGYEAPEARLALDTAVAVVASMVAVLVAIRFLVDGRLLDLLLSAGFVVAGLGTIAFGVVPKLTGGMVPSREAWAAICSQVVGAALIACAPFVGRRVTRRSRALLLGGAGSLLLLGAIWPVLTVTGFDDPLAGDDGSRAAVAVLGYAMLAVLALVAAIGFGLRFRRFGRDLDSWLARANGGNGFDSNVGDSSFTNCTAIENTGAFGFRLGGGATLLNCTASDNTSVATTSAGISAGGDSTVIGCTANNNRTTNGTLTSTTGIGISVGSGSTVKNCTVASNSADGIRLTSNSLVAGNMARDNGFSTGIGSGIHSTSSDNRIEDNNVVDNDLGIEVASSGSLIIKNSASGNTLNYVIAASNQYGVILDLTAPGSAAASGSSAPGTLTTTTNPWANFSY
jgi:parallel beta-helix repeat protein